MIMDVIIVCHTEFGFMKNGALISDKNAIRGVKEAVPNLIKLANKYDSKITFAVMPEVAKYIPKDIDQEVGVHIHPGLNSYKLNGKNFQIGDTYLHKKCSARSNSSVLKDYSFTEQLNLIETGKNFLEEKFDKEIKTFVAGRWSINNDTIKALIESKITHDCSAAVNSKSGHYDWSILPRFSTPYEPSIENYQIRGNLPLTILPISCMFMGGNVNPEAIPKVGLSWLKACFLEHFDRKVPLFHICLHSASMTDPFYISSLDKFLEFISKRNIKFKFASQIKASEDKCEGLNFAIYHYLFRLNRQVMCSIFKDVTINKLR